MGSPIRTFPGQRLLGTSPRLFAPCNVLHRRFVSRYPPCALIAHYRNTQWCFCYTYLLTFFYCWTLWIVKYSRFCYNIPILSDNCIQYIYRCLKTFLKKNRLQANTVICNARFYEIYNGYAKYGILFVLCNNVYPRGPGNARTWHQNDEYVLCPIYVEHVCNRCLIIIYNFLSPVKPTLSTYLGIVFPLIHHNQ